MLLHLSSGRWVSSAVVVWMPVHRLIHTRSRKLTNPRLVDSPYCFSPTVMSGILGDLKGSKELFLQVSKLVKRKNNNLEKFCSRRVSI